MDAPLISDGVSGIGVVALAGAGGAVAGCFFFAGVGGFFAGAGGTGAGAGGAGGAVGARVAFLIALSKPGGSSGGGGRFVAILARFFLRVFILLSLSFFPISFSSFVRDDYIVGSF